MTVVKYMSFSKAAGELYITQPAISRHISNLENELCVPMFDRAGKNITLTEAGEKYYDFFKTFMKGLNELQDIYSRQDRSLSGTVSYLAFPGWIMSDFLMDNAALISGKHPNLVIIQKFDGADCINQLKSGTLDTVFSSYDALSYIPEIDCVKLIDIPRVILYSNRHRLSDKESLSLSDFRNETFIFLPDDTMTSQAFSRILCKVLLPYGFQPKIKPALDYDSMMFMIESCNGVTMVDTISRAYYNPNFRSLKIDSMSSIGLAWKRGNDSPALKIFINETVLFFEKIKLTL